MTRVILRLHWLLLKRDRAALVLSFILPLVFFSVFSAVYFQIGDDRTARVVRIAILDLDGSDLSRHLLSELRKEPRLGVEEIQAKGGQTEAVRTQIRELVRNGSVPVGVILPPGFGDGLEDDDQKGPPVQLLEDRSDAPAVAICAAMFDAALTRIAAQAWAAQALEAVRSLSDKDRTVELPLPPSGDEAVALLSAARNSIQVERIDVLGGTADGHKSAAVAYFAAGTGVLFLLFTMAGAAATLLDEKQDGTLERLLTCGIGIGQLLAYKWVFYSLLGSAQVGVMFLWGWAVFGLELFTTAHLAGFVVMTALTALAAAALGIALATACRTRAQFTGISTILILVMSALGGSMFPRFLMSDTLKSVGLATFNAWALDGYQKVFWYEAALYQLWPQLTVLALVAAALMGIARVLAAKWVVE